MTKGKFGIHGGQFVPETLMNAINEFEEAYNQVQGRSLSLLRELDTLMREYAGRPSLLYYAEKMTKDLGGAKIYLKREDLNHTGAHKINNVPRSVRFLQREWAKQELLPKPAQVSTVLQRQPPPHLYGHVNAKSLWAKRTQSVRL